MIIFEKIRLKMTIDLFYKIKLLNYLLWKTNETIKND